MTASPTIASKADAPAAAFPGDDALCEACGYPIRGLQPQGQCPECGSAVAESHPDRRTGPAFENRPGLIGYLLTALAVMHAPKRTFRAMRVGGDKQPCRRFLLMSALAAAVLWLVGGLVTDAGNPQLNGFSDRVGWMLTTPYSLLGVTLVFFGVIVLTYIEVLGVAWFSRRRGWRVPLPLAERVACYASIGWLPGAAVLGLMMNLERSRLLIDNLLWIGVPTTYAGEAAWAVVFFVGVLAMLGFETLVWVGVRQAKFANPSIRPDRHASPPPA